MTHREKLVAERNELQIELRELKAGQHEHSIEPLQRKAEILDAMDSIELELARTDGWGRALKGTVTSYFVLGTIVGTVIGLLTGQIVIAAILGLAAGVMYSRLVSAV